MPEECALYKYLVYICFVKLLAAHWVPILMYFLRHPPVFNEWFLRNFPDPTAW